MAVRRKRGAPPIIDLEDFDESINIMLYGDSGVGKTVFAGSGDDVLFLATEKGTISAKRQGSRAKVWPIEKWEDLQDAFLYLRDEEHGYKWVALDSATKMQHMALRWILDDAHAQNPSRDLDIPAIQDHQKWQNMFKRFVTNFCDLPVNVIFTATTMRAEDEEGENIILPDLQGKGYGISQWVCAQMHVVAYISVKRKGKGDDKETWRRIQTQTVPPYFGKDRYNCLGEYNSNGSCVRPYLDNVTLTDIEKLIASSGTVDESPKRTSRGTATRKRSATTRKSSVVDDDMEEDD